MNSIPQTQAQGIRLILSDVDGVLTDGGLSFDNSAVEHKRFHVRDGLGIKLWKQAGYKFGLITARNSHIVQSRALELGIDLVRQGAENKLPTAKAIAEQLGISSAAVCYIGDDLTDLPVVRWAGLGVAVADAAQDLKQHARWVTTLPGGHGAVRELIEQILQVQRLWPTLVQTYLDEV